MSRICYSNITYACNNACTFCVSKNVLRHSAKVMTLEDFDFLANEFSLGPNDMFTISGGEPTLSPYFNEIISFCHGITQHIVVYSNGRAMSLVSEETLNAIERIIIPLYGPEKIHNAYVHNNHAYQEMVESLFKVISKSENKIDIKILLDNAGKTESLFDTKDWDMLSNNLHFSITRVISPENNLNGIEEQTKRASNIIKKLLELRKIVRFYDFPFCMLDTDLQEHVIKTFVPVDAPSHSVICGSAGKQYRIYDFNKRANYFNKCLGCNFHHFCTKIMQNYFTPVTTADRTIITTE